MSGFVIKFAAPSVDLSLLVEDDGRVGYAYFLGSDGKICGDVWLYNRKMAPIEPEWSDLARAPFANSEAYVDANKLIPPPVGPNDISIEWQCKNGKWFATIFVGSARVAVLSDGSRPGWSNLVKQDGPLARRLTDDPGNDSKISSY